MNEIKKLFPLLKIYSWIIPVVVTIGIAASLFEGIGISLFIPLLKGSEVYSYSSSISNNFVGFLDDFLVFVFKGNALFSTAFLIFVAILLKSILTYSNSIIFSWYNHKISHQLRIDIFHQLATVSYSFLNSCDSGKLINTLATETWRVSSALSTLFDLIINICTILIFMALLFLISGKLTLLVIIALTFISAFIRFVTLKARDLGIEAVKANEFLTQKMWEGYSGMKVIRYFGRENYEQARFNRASQEVKDTFFKMDLLSSLVNPLSEILASILLISILAVSLKRDPSTLPMLLTFILILYRLQPRVRQLDACRVGLSSLASSVETVMYLLERSDKPYIRSGTIPFKELTTCVSFQNVSFRYKQEDRAALQNISFSIPKGKTTALVGTSGAGKSTIINLVYRFYEPDRGTIKVDGYPLAELNLKDWRSSLAIVSQDIYMFSTTIKENIAYGRLNATETEIINAAKLAHADEFISQFPNGYDTKVGDRGVRLSGGQKQRIALARAILSQPEILILDEATNALDSISENIIQEAIATLSKKCTVIAIAHRLSTVETADQIIVLDAGQIVEQGNLQQLLRRQGLFAKLYSLQNRNTSVDKQLN